MITFTKPTKRDACAAYLKAIADSRKGPQINPHPTEQRRREHGRIMVRDAGKRIKFARASNRFCVLPLDQLRGLPECGINTADPGVYFLWYGPELIYIGKGVYVGDRIHRHRKDGVKPFTHATYLRGPDEFIRGFEADYVHRYHPPFNFTGTG